MTVNRRTSVRLVVLALLLSALGGILYRNRHPRPLPLSVPQPTRVFTLHGPYQSEESWIVGEIVRDIVEMAAYPAPTPPLTIDRGGPGLYDVGLRKTSVRVDLRDDLWAPERFAPVAQAVATLMGRGEPAASAPDPIAAHEALVNPSPATLVAISQSISHDLGSNMRSAALHESAALTLGAFAMSEPPWSPYYDPRWAMNRMTAHLAMASACQCGAPTMDGRLAGVVLLLLEHRQVRALQALDELSAEVHTRAVDVWTRVLRMHITRDTRKVDPAALVTQLEKREYFLMRYRWTSAVAQQLLQEMHVEPSTFFVRIVEAAQPSVEEGWVIDRAQRLERNEYEDVFRRIHGRDIEPDPIPALNERATRCAERGTPDVLPWGAWAEFAQRQLALYVNRLDYYWRTTISVESTADSEKRRVDAELDRLAFFPFGAIYRQTGPYRRTVGDYSYFARAAAVATETPERANAALWTFVEKVSHYDTIRMAVPKAASWLIEPSARIPYDASARVSGIPFRVPAETLLAIHEIAPYDVNVATEYMATKYREQKTSFENLKAIYGPLFDYDAGALQTAMYYVEGDDGLMILLRKACDVRLDDCVNLAWHLARRDRAFAAAALYERVFADPGIDAVMVANSSGWLVSYYYTHNRRDAALALAKRAAGTGSSGGLITLAYLYERMGRYQESERLYREDFERYEQPNELFGFYYRATKVHHLRELEPRFDELLKRVLPRGLVPLKVSGTKPEHGVVITQDNEDVRRQGLQVGDIIVGLEGWQVDSLGEFRAINKCFTEPAMKLTVWRGKTSDAAGKTMNLEIVAQGRYMGIYFQTYPHQLETD